MNKNKTPEILCTIAIILFVMNCIIAVITWLVGDSNIQINSDVKKILESIIVLVMITNHVSALIILGYSRIKYKWHTLSGVLFWCLISETILLIVAFIVLAIIAAIAIISCINGLNVFIDTIQSCPG